MLTCLSIQAEVLIVAGWLSLISVHIYHWERIGICRYRHSQQYFNFGSIQCPQRKVSTRTTRKRAQGSLARQRYESRLRDVRKAALLGEQTKITFMQLTYELQTSVIKESLRISYGAISPLPRIVGPSSAEIGGVQIPEGVRPLTSSILSQLLSFWLFCRHPCLWPQRSFMTMQIHFTTRKNSIQSAGFNPILGTWTTISYHSLEALAVVLAWSENHIFCFDG